MPLPASTVSAPPPLAMKESLPTAPNTESAVAPEMMESSPEVKVKRVIAAKRSVSVPDRTIEPVAPRLATMPCVRVP